jgi:hypothetical protein
MHFVLVYRRSAKRCVCNGRTETKSGYSIFCLHRSDEFLELFDDAEMRNRPGAAAPERFAT